MRHSYLDSFSFIVIIVLFLFTHRATSIGTIKQTCRTCADRSKAFSYGFCVSSLQNSSISHASNLHGLAVASMLQALDNATDTVSTIKKLMASKGFDPFALSCLRDCLELYSDSVETLVDAVRSFLRRQYGTASIRLSAAMEAAVTCEKGFGERRGEVAPLRTENYSLFQLGDVALCIINMLSLSVSTFLKHT